MTNQNDLQASLKEVTKSLKEQFKAAGNVFSEWLSVSSAAGLLISQIKNSISGLKEVDTLLTDISRENSRLSKADLEKIGQSAFDISGRYGKSATEYLSSVLEASRAGYQNPKGIAELSMAAQTAGNMTAELTEQVIAATDKAYRMNGSVTELTKVLDGMNYITSHNTVTMQELAEGMASISSTAAALGIDVNETTAALGTMLAVTQQSGSEAADAFQTILLNIGQVADAKVGIDAEGLEKYEQACKSLNVSLEETKNGVRSMRDPMEVLAALSDAYNRLDEGDIRKTNLLDSLGSTQAADQLDALLSQWGIYESMLGQYADGMGSMAADAQKAADSWEGSLNRLSNTWTATVGNIADSEAITTGINALNGLLGVINDITGALDSWGSIGLGAGLFAGIKNVGSPKMFGRNNVLNIPTVCQFCWIQQFRIYSPCDTWT